MADDEAFAKDLIEKHFHKQGIRNLVIAQNRNDPPDITINFPHGEKWGIEVTRVYQPVKKFGSNQIASSIELQKLLEILADEIGEQTKEIRKRDYTLYLETPGPFSSIKSDIDWKTHQQGIKKRVHFHIEHDRDQILRFQGGTLRPGNSGTRWSPLICSNPTAEIKSTLSLMLKNALFSKLSGLDRWSGNCTQRFLLLLDCYGLAERTDVEDAILHISNHYPDLSRFDGLFWAPANNRRLIKFCIS